MAGKGRKYTATYFISSISLTSTLVEYGISAIFVIFLMNVLHFSMDLTSNVYGFYYTFAFLMPIPIGYISDKYLNITSSVIIGFVSIIISQIILFFCASLYIPSNIILTSYVINTQTILYFIGLIFLGTGIGFITLSFTNLINTINTSGTSNENSYSIYYSLLNLGIILGIVIMSLIVGEDNFESFKWAFLVFAICISIALISFLLFKNKFLIDSKGNPIDTDSLDFGQIKKNLNRNLMNRLISKTNISKEKLMHMNFRKKRKLFISTFSPSEKRQFKLFLFLLVFLLIYRIAFSQSNISIIFFIEEYVQRNIGFYSIPVETFCIFNPVLILILGPLFIKFNNKLEEKNINIGLITRISIAIILISVCFLILTYIGFIIDMNIVDNVSIFWMILFEIILAISELFFSVAGYSMISKVSPSNYFELFFGIFIATRAVATFISGLLCTMFPESTDTIYYIGTMPINGLCGFFSIFVILNLISGIILFSKRKKFENLSLEEIE